MCAIEHTHTSNNSVATDPIMERGMLEDVLVKVGEFILPANFIVLNMEECPSPLPLPIILGRPLMRTTDTMICVKKRYCEYEGKW
jgi:hypothetical protein